MTDDEESRPEMDDRIVSRRRFLGEAALGAAGVTAVATQPSCSDDGVGHAATVERAFLRPSREEWKRREAHPAAARGWSDTNFKPASPGVPSTIAVFDRILSRTEFSSVLLDVAQEQDVVYAFWDGSFVKQTETVAPIDSVADLAGATLPGASTPFVIARSPTRSEVFVGASDGILARLEDESYRYRYTFPRQVALDSGVIIFAHDTELRYYAFAVEGYGARAFVKYFASLEGGDTYVGPDDTVLDDYLVSNIPSAQFFDLDSETVVGEVPAWNS